MRKPTADIKERILECAVAMLRQSGLKSLGQIQVAKSANVSQGHLTYHFPKRADLILAVAERAVQPVWNLVGDLSSKSSALTEAAIMKLAKKVLRDSQRTRALLGLLVESDENPDLLTELRQRSDRERTMIAMAVGKDEKDPYVFMVQAALFGTAIQHYLHRDTPTAKNLDRTLELLSTLAKDQKKKGS